VICKLDGDDLCKAASVWERRSELKEKSKYLEVLQEVHKLIRRVSSQKKVKGASESSSVSVHVELETTLI